MKEYKKKNALKRKLKSKKRNAHQIHQIMIISVIKEKIEILTIFKFY